MRAILISILILTLAIRISAQDDKQAISILDKFSAAALEAPSVSMKFNLISLDQLQDKSDTLDGSVILNKDKYRLELPDNTVWFNGETSWSYLPAESEVTITNAGKKDNSFQNRPSAIYTMYKKDFKSRLVEEKPESYLIDLYPKDIKSDIVRVRLILSKPGLKLKSLEYKKRDGMVHTFHFLTYDLTTKPDPDVFIFPSAKYKGVEVIDMR
jgi:outer membrane lipoprotein carrier protein